MGGKGKKRARTAAAEEAKIAAEEAEQAAVAPAEGSADSSRPTGKRKTKRRARAADIADGGAERPEDEAGEPCGKANKASAPAGLSVEERLAAFGDAFLDSLEGGPPKPLRRRPDPASKKRENKPAPQVAVEEESASQGPGSEDEASSTAFIANFLRKETAQAGSAAQTPKVKSFGVSGGRGAASAGDAASGAAHHQRRMSASEKRRFMSGKVSNCWGEKKPPPEPSRRNKKKVGDEDDDDPEFKGALKEMLNFVMPRLGKTERKQYEAQKIRALGGTPDKRPQLPMRHMVAAQKRHDEKRKAKIEEDKYLGVKTSASNHNSHWDVERLRRVKRDEMKDKKQRRSDRITDIGMGARERNGIAYIPKRSIANMGQS